MVEADADALRFAKTVSSYDTAIDVVRESCNDPASMAFLRRRKHDFERSMRGADASLLKALADERERLQAQASAKHKELWAADKQREVERQAKKKVDAEKAALVEAERDKQRRLHLYSLGRDRSWKADDLGTNTAYTGAHRRNIREALDRMKMRSPPLPDHLEAVWPRFREDYPRRAREKWGVKLGKVLLTNLELVLDALGSHAIENPGLKSKKPRKASGGDPTAFAKFVSQELKLKAGDGAIQL